ncbi:hypothetical protein AMS68_000443 [Peltaster fructicola]|uniref:Uncharacterized protein n=1 Tax=Peltaster fructicola TaxID=286661 RepID=A0A6H0XJN5_9PEZI|nr:hypothetical protein AMS68_000443 [Peltaster fructicola]
MVNESQVALDSLIPFDADATAPVTPQPANATIEGLGSTKLQTGRSDHAHLTPPPSTQIAIGELAKHRTPTPTFSSISTPPPTVDTAIQSKYGAALAASMTSEQLATSNAEDLRIAVTDLQAAYQEAKMSAAHYKLQYQMLAQESAAAIERMAVEARMAQHENDIIQMAEQAKSAATPVQTHTIQDGMIPVQKDLYQKMCLEIQHLNRLVDALHSDNQRQGRVIIGQENEIESLSDRVSLMRDRIRSNRDHARRQSAPSHNDYTPRSYATPHRAGQDQFAALLQASEIASQEANPRSKKAAKNVTMTPQRYKQPQQYATPSRPPVYAIPATAPMPRTEVFQSPTAYAQTPVPKAQSRKAPLPPPPPPRSEETVSNSDRDVDSEAETDILEPDGNVAESQASRAASLMLRTSQEGSFHGVPPAQPPKMKQTRLFGAVRKPNTESHDDGRPSKRPRTAGGIGLGIANAR